MKACRHEPAVAALAPSVAAIRNAVRAALSGYAVPARGERAERAPQSRSEESRVLVACSGGPDSLALAAATAFVAPRLGLRPGLITVDHQLQPGSADRAQAVAGWAEQAGFDPVEVCTVDVTTSPDAAWTEERRERSDQSDEGRRHPQGARARVGGGRRRHLGPEAAARQARYAALVDAAQRHGAAAVLLGHTRDDQAETVLLALARGAGPRGLAGMPVRREVDGVTLLRPLLDIARDQAADACAVLDVKPWADPHNADPAYARSRVRTAALPALTAALGPDVVDNLARTARLLAVDTEYLDALASAALDGARVPGCGGLDVGRLAALPAALRGRVLHAFARECGAPGAALAYQHIEALEALVNAWHGQGPVHLPGGIEVGRGPGPGGQAALDKVK